jgi:hypothetical protein
MAPLVFLRSPKEERREELINGALHLFLAPINSELPSGPKTQETRQEIEEMCAAYRTDAIAARMSPTIEASWNFLDNLMKNLATSADQCRHAGRHLPVGLATGNLQDSLKITQDKLDQINSFEKILARAAADLDRINNSLRPWRVYHENWENQNIGRNRSSEFIFCNPKDKLVYATACLYLRHYPIADFSAGKKDRFYEIMERIIEIATDSPPEKNEWLRTIQRVVTLLKQQ